LSKISGLDNARLQSTTERGPRARFVKKELAALTANATDRAHRLWVNLVHYQGNRYSELPAHAGKTRFDPMGRLVSNAANFPFNSGR
jgi:hypothetical protein